MPGLTERFELKNSRKSIYAQEIIAKGGIADLAAQLMPSEGDSKSRILEAIRLSLLLREAEEFVLDGLRKCGDIESGLARCNEAWDAHRSAGAASAVIPINENQNRRFEDGLRAIMPKLKSDYLRMLWFREWLASDFAQQLVTEIQAFEKEAYDEGLSLREHIKAVECGLVKRLELAQLEKDPQGLLIKADEKIKEMQEHGMPVSLFERAATRLPDWRRKEIRKRRSAAGRKGAEKKRATANEKALLNKQKRKRTPRPPVGELKKIFSKF